MSGAGEGGRLRARLSLLLGLLLFFLTLLAPAPAGLEPRAQRMAAVGLLMAVWWIGEAIPIPATALLPVALYPLLGILSSRDAAEAYAHPLVFLFFGGFLIALAMERWDLHRRIALAMVHRLGSGARRLVLGFLASTAGLSMWISNTATTLMMLPIGMAVVEELAERAQQMHGSREAAERVRRNFGAVLMFAIAYGASIGGMGTLIGTPPNLVLAGQLRELFPAHPELGFLRWMLFAVPVVVVLLAAAYLVITRVGPQEPLGRLPLGAGTAEAVAEQRAQLGPMSAGERRVLVAFLAAALLWMTRAPLRIGALTVPGWSLIFAHPKQLHDATVAIAIGLALLVLRAPARDPAREGETVALLDWDSVQAGVPWGILILFGGGLSLAAGFQATGLAEWLAGRLEAFGRAPLPVLIGGVCVLTALLTEVTSNTATATVLMPILAAMAKALGVPPLLLMAPAALAASCAFMLPVATPPNAIVFGSGYLTIPRMAWTGVALDLVAVAVITFFASRFGPALLGTP